MKTVLITGISKGIGKALAEQFLAEGHRVLGTVRSGSAPFSHELLTIFTLDLSSPESIAAGASAIREYMQHEARSNGGTIDILINNAGVLLDEDDTTLVPEKLRATLEVNLVGTADFAERMLPLVAKDGHIVFLASTAGSISLAIGPNGTPEGHYPYHYPAYKISKAALNMYMRTLAIRLMKDGTTVSSVHPGWVKTDMGGEEAEITPAEAAADIYALAISRPETGQFWHKGKKMEW